MAATRGTSPPYRQRGPAALAAAAQRDAVGVDKILCQHGIDGPDAIGIDPAVIVIRLVQRAPRHEAGEGGGAAPRIGHVAHATGAALTARVHLEMREARGRPMHLFMWQATATAIADKLHDQRQPPGPVARQDQPALDGMASEAGEGDVKHLDRAKGCGGGLQDDLSSGRAGLGQGRLPEPVKIRRRRNVTAIGGEVGMDQVGKGHGASVFWC